MKNPIIRWLRKRPQGPTPPFKLDGIIEQKRQQLHAVDPETARRWQSLNVAMVPRFRSRVHLRKWAFAMSFAVIAALIALKVLWPTQDASLTYETGRGQHTSILLPDSTEVTLNHTSGLVISAMKPEQPRSIVLNGEAFFHVRRNGTPFSVSAHEALILVTGTEFNVRSRENRLEVGVLSGSVQVTVRRDGTDSTVVLTRGYLVSCMNGAFPGTPVPLSTSDFPAWIHGKFFFDRTSIASACREFASYFNVEIRIENPNLEGETITGTIDGRSIETSLSTIGRLTGSRFRTENHVYILY